MPIFLLWIYLSWLVIILGATIIVALPEIFRDLARVHGPAVLEELARLALESESDQARVAAAKEILDRAYGKCAQPIFGDEGGPTILRVITGVRG